MRLLDSRESALLGVITGLSLLKLVTQAMYPMITPLVTLAMLFSSACCIYVIGWRFYLKLTGFNLAWFILSLPEAVASASMRFEALPRLFEGMLITATQRIHEMDIPLSEKQTMVESLYVELSPHLIILRTMASPWFWGASLLFGFVVMYVVVIPAIYWVLCNRRLLIGLPSLKTRRRTQKI